MSTARSNDLVVLAADKNIELGIRGLLSRAPSLGIRPVVVNVFVHPERDPGCLLRSQDFLRPLHREYDHALVVFDREGCGREGQCRTQIESTVEELLAKSGWRSRAAAVVIDPELENWVWNDSPQVDTALGWAGRVPDLRAWLRQQGLLPDGLAKPPRPKEAVVEALRRARKPRSAALYRTLGEIATLEHCTDPAFQKLRTTLQRWFETGSAG